MRTPLSFLVAALWLGSCLSTFVGCGYGCDASFRYGLLVRVVDADGTPVCGAMVVAVDGNYQETLQPEGEGVDCRYLGAGERSGTYELTATKVGFAPASVEVTVEDEDRCHVAEEPVQLVMTAE